MSDLPDLVNELQRTMGEGGSRLFDVVPAQLRTVIKQELWKQCADKKGQPFPNFEAFVVHKLWWGLESNIDDLLAYCRNAPEVQSLIREQVPKTYTHVEAGAKGGRGKKANSNTTSFSDRGSTYALRRLKREKPKLAEQVIAGKLTANAAAIQAGFRKATWSAPAEPELLAAAVAKRYPGWKMVRT
jgi:hypothetical protein